MTWTKSTSIKDRIGQLLRIDIKTTNILLDYFEYGIESKYHHIHNYPVILQPIIFTFGIILVKLNSIFLNSTKKIDIQSSKFVFVTGYDHIIRAENIIKIASGIEHSVIYLPSLNLKEIKRHIAFFRKKNINNIYYPCFSIVSSIKLLFFIIRNLILLFSIKPNGNSKLERRFLYKLLFQYYLYDNFSKSELKSSFQYKEIKWLFDFDRTFFIAVINNLKKNNIPNIHLQHGVLKTPNKFYIPNYCDIVFCCSEREKQHYVNNGTNSENVYVLGGPLQSLDKKENFPKCSVQYDILVLLTIASIEEYLKVQIMVLDLLKHKFHDKSILLRFRPASSKLDKILLHNYIKDFDVSLNNSLIYDILRSKIVISFSFDALFDVIRESKPFLIVTLDDNLDEFIKPFCSSDEYSIENNLLSLINDETCVQYSKDALIYAFGEGTYKIVEKRFRELINIKLNN